MRVVFKKLGTRAGVRGPQGVAKVHLPAATLISLNTR